MEIIIKIIITVTGNYPHEDYDNADDNTSDGHDHGDDDDDDDYDDDDHDDNEDGDGDGDGDGNNGNYGNYQHEEISFEGNEEMFDHTEKQSTTE